MAAVDVGQWVEFRVGDLFEIEKVHGKPLSDYTDGDIPYVTGSEGSNGVIGFVSAPIEAISEGNCIAVDPIKGFAMYQPDDFVGRGFSGASINLLRSDKLTENVGLFICPVIEQVTMRDAAYTDLFGVARLAKAEIALPATNDGQPDWAYMEAYMGSVMEQQVAVVDALSRMATEKRPVDVGSWVEFDLVGEDGIFKDYERGKVSVARDLDDGNTPYVGAVFPKNNNGVQRYVSPKSDDQVTKGNCLVMVCDGAAIGCNMYQPSDFVGTTNLKIVRNEHLNELTGLFLASALDASARRSGYSYFWKRNDENIRKEKIKLPATPNGEPDWAFMEEYMRKVMNQQGHVVEVLSRICKH